ncbi:MAG TPA: radical SAM protein, partial [Luteolibacter sp.]|nr:radical SAM protein [Luteolibacter sp.]
MITSEQGHAAFFRERFPLIRLFEFGQDILLYDAKPHFAVVFSDKEMSVLRDFLSGQSQEDILRKHAGALADRKTGLLLRKISELREAGVFLEGPVEEVSPVDPEAIREQIDRFQESILLRKFCLSVTDDCNFRCTYCKRTLGGEEIVNSRTALSEENAFLAIDYYFEKYIAIFKKLSPSKQRSLLESSPPCLSWYGGEPFLNFPVIRSSAAYFKTLPWQDHGIPDSVLRFTTNTNLSVLNDEMIRFLIDHQVLLFASLDGPADEHDRCRVFANGRGTFSAAYRNLMRIKET